MANARTPREAWIAEGLRALAAGGPEAVRVERLAEALGVSKGGFYWYFTNRDALLTEMLGAWEHGAVDDVIERIEAQGGDARSRLHQLYGLATSDADVLRIDLAMRDWARRDKAIARRLRRVDNRRMDYMRSLFREFVHDDDEVEVRCLFAFALWIGNHFIAADHAGRRRDDVLALALAHLES